MKLHESGEDYLEMILMLQKEKGSVRSIDVATAMNFSKASVSRAMSILKKEGFLIMEKSGELILTEKGHKRANEVLDRHRCITKYIHLVLGVDLAIADHDACRIEHIISPETFAKIKEKLTILENTTK
jgi:Mn-dependent DtxR family transcriptional regulator